ncbi:class I adenylate-forming enzyme family protein [Sphingopyxis witflariensis]|uniref:AMP-dependent synthetase n=1 Tax=Sphingopyxis witflariensis TaxID=173675 RepID=A0A246JVG5_9SPHN|nr:AMP-binding protein [Sphingopyxis witflariensis]OWQ96532.1 AMP-dependent synthetase [Sphingopyxis witflariensis]
MKHSDPIFDAVTAPGTPFELGERGGMRRFVNAPDDLNQLIESARAFGDRVCVAEGDTHWTYAQMFARRDALAGILDIERGDRVAICMRNRSEWMIGFLATIRCGGVAALLNSRGSPSELCAAIDDVSPAVVLADSGRAALLREGGYTGRLIVVADFPATGTAPANITPAKKSDPAAILFTSGTTGRVKGAVLTHENLMTGIMGTQLAGTMVLHNTARDLKIPVSVILENMPQQVTMLVVPLFHISGLGASFLSPLLAGSKIVVMRRWAADEAMELIEREKVTMFSGVPTMMWDIVHAGKGKKADLSSLRNIGMGGQAMPVSLLNELRAACPDVVMGTGYGMTETSGSVAMSMGEDFIRNRASAGRVLSLVDVRIEGPDGNVLPAGEVGEIVVRGPMVMQGYWQRPEETAAVLSPDGWLKTGDVGLIDPEGYIFIVDRAKDMVISGGENIYCAEVERIVNAMPEVVECAAFGIADDRLGELLVARVVGDNVDAAAIIAEVADKLARYKAPAQVRVDAAPLPRNDVGKIDKKRLRTEWTRTEGNPA